jgi:hypothetical protein
MPDPVPLDSLSTSWDPVTEQIRVRASSGDPADTSHYYRWTTRITREVFEPGVPPTTCWQSVSPSGISVRSDRLVQGNRITEEVFSIESGVDATFLHQVGVQQRVITQKAYEFWSTVETQVENAGDPFSPPPAPIRGNVVRVQDSTNFALGYFEVAGASHRQTTCFRQSGVEGAPRTPRPPSESCERRNTVSSPPSYWQCSDGSS